MSINKIEIEFDPKDPSAYKVTIPHMRLQNLWLIITDIQKRIEAGEFDSNQTEHPDLTSIDPESDILN